MAIKFRDRGVTLDHLINPQVGDNFTERFSYFCWVLEVTPDYVIYADTTGAEARYRERCQRTDEVADKDTRCEVPMDLRLIKETRATFATKTWVDYSQNVDVTDWLEAITCPLFDGTITEIELMRVSLVLDTDTAMREVGDIEGGWQTSEVTTFLRSCGKAVGKARLVETIAEAITKVWALQQQQAAELPQLPLSSMPSLLRIICPVNYAANRLQLEVSDTAIWYLQGDDSAEHRDRLLLELTRILYRLEAPVCTRTGTDELQAMVAA